MEANKLRYTVCDLNNQDGKKVFTRELEEYGLSVDDMPVVIINGMYVGGINEVQDMVDEGYLMPIINKGKVVQ